jgi:hypothetical protein
MGGEAEHLRRLRQSDLAASEVERILGDREAPRGEAISLVETVFWRGLAYLSTNALVHPEVRRAADLQL